MTNLAKRLFSLLLSFAFVFLHGTQCFPLKTHALSANSTLPFTAEYDHWIHRLTLHFDDPSSAPITAEIIAASSKNEQDEGQILNRQSITLSPSVTKISLKDLYNSIVTSSLLYIGIQLKGEPIYWVSDPNGFPSQNYVYPPKDLQLTDTENGLLAEWSYGYHEYTPLNTTHLVSTDGKSFQEVFQLSYLLPDPDVDAFYIKTKYKGKESVVCVKEIEKPAEVTLYIQPTSPLPKAFTLMVGEFPATPTQQGYTVTLPRDVDYAITLDDGGYQHYLLSPNLITAQQDQTISLDVLGVELAFQESPTLTTQDGEGILTFAPLADADQYSLEINGTTTSITQSPYHFPLSQYSLGSSLTATLTPERYGFQGKNSSTSTFLTGYLVGKVWLENQPLANATVTFQQQTTLSNLDGSFSFRGLEQTGIFPLQISYQGISMETSVAINQIENRCTIPFTGGGTIKGTIPDADQVFIKDDADVLIQTIKPINGVFSSNLLPYGDYLITAKNKDNTQHALIPYTLQENSKPLSAQLISGKQFSLTIPIASPYTLKILDSLGKPQPILAQYNYGNGIIAFITKSPSFALLSTPTHSGIQPISFEEENILSLTEGKVQMLTKLPDSFTTGRFNSHPIPLYPYGEDNLMAILPQQDGILALWNDKTRGIIPISLGIPERTAEKFGEGTILFGQVEDQTDGVLFFYAENGELVAKQALDQPFFTTHIPTQQQNMLVAYQGRTNSAVTKVSIDPYGFSEPLSLTPQKGKYYPFQLPTYTPVQIKTHGMKPNEHPAEPFLLQEGNRLYALLSSEDQWISFVQQDAISVLSMIDEQLFTLQHQQIHISPSSPASLPFTSETLVILQVEQTFADGLTIQSNLHPEPIPHHNGRAVFTNPKEKEVRLIFETPTHSGQLFIPKQTTPLLDLTTQSIALQQGQLVYGSAPSVQQGKVTVYNTQFQVVGSGEIDHGYFAFSGIEDGLFLLAEDDEGQTALQSLGDEPPYFLPTDFYPYQPFIMTLDGVLQPDQLTILQYSATKKDSPDLLPFIFHHNKAIILGAEEKPVIFTDQIQSYGGLLAHDKTIALLYGITLVANVEEGTTLSIRDDAESTDLSDRLPYLESFWQGGYLFISHLPMPQTTYTLFFQDGTGTAIKSIKPNSYGGYIHTLTFGTGTLLYGKVYGIEDPSNIQITVLDEQGRILGAGGTNSIGYYEVSVMKNSTPYYTYGEKQGYSGVSSLFLQQDDQLYQTPFPLTEGTKRIIPPSLQEASFYEITVEESIKLTPKWSDKIYYLNLISDSTEFALGITGKGERHPQYGGCYLDLSGDQPSLIPESVLQSGGVIFGQTEPYSDFSLSKASTSQARQDEQGRFILQGLTECHQILFAEKGETSGGQEIELDPKLPFQLLPTLTLSEGRIVIVDTPADQAALEGAPSLWDGNRHFFTGVKQGEYLLTAQNTKGNPSSGADFVTMERENLIAELPLSPGGILTGQLDPISAVQITAYTTKDKQIGSGILSSTGRFCIPGIPPKESLLITAEGEGMSGVRKVINPSAEPVQFPLSFGKLVKGRITGGYDGTVLGYDEGGLIPQGETNHTSYYLAGTMGEGMVGIQQKNLSAAAKIGDPLHLTNGKLYSGQLTNAMGQGMKGSVTLYNRQAELIFKTESSAKGYYLFHGRGDEGLFYGASTEGQQYAMLLSADTPSLHRQIKLDDLGVVFGQTQPHAVVEMGHRKTTSNPQGLFLFSGVPEGKHYLSARKGQQTAFLLANTGTPLHLPLGHQNIMSKQFLTPEGTPLIMTQWNGGENPLTTDQEGFLVYDKDQVDEILPFIHPQYSLLLQTGETENPLIAKTGHLYQGQLQDAEGKPLAHQNILLDGNPWTTDKEGILLADGVIPNSLIHTTTSAGLLWGNLQLDQETLILSPSPWSAMGQIESHISSTESGTIRLYALPSLELIWETPIDATQNSYGFSTIPQGNLLITVHRGKEVGYGLISSADSRKILPNIQLQEGKLLLSSLPFSTGKLVVGNQLIESVEDTLILILPLTQDELEMTHDILGLAKLSLPNEGIIHTPLPFMPFSPEVCQLFYPNQQPLADAQIRLFRTDGEEVALLTSSSTGLFYRPAHVRDELLRIQVEKDGISTNLPLPAGQKRLQLSGQSFLGSVQLSNGSPITHGTLAIPQLGIEQPITAGKLALIDLPYGKYDLHYDIGGLSAPSVSLVVDALGIAVERPPKAKSDTLILPMPQGLMDLEQRFEDDKGELSSFIDLCDRLAETPASVISHLSLSAQEKLMEMLTQHLSFQHRLPEDLPLQPDYSFLLSLPFQELKILLDYCRKEGGKGWLELRWATTPNPSTPTHSLYSFHTNFSLTPTLYLKGIAEKNGRVVAQYLEEYSFEGEGHFLVQALDHQLLALYHQQEMIGLYEEGDRIPYQRNFQYLLGRQKQFGSSGGHSPSSPSIPSWTDHLEQLFTLPFGSHYEITPLPSHLIPREILLFLSSPYEMTLQLEDLTLTPNLYSSIPTQSEISYTELKAWLEKQSDSSNSSATFPPSPFDSVENPAEDIHSPDPSPESNPNQSTPSTHHSNCCSFCRIGRFVDLWLKAFLYPIRLLLSFIPPSV